MIADRRLALLIAVWAGMTWGGRIGLLTGDVSSWAKWRIAVSLALAVLAVIGLSTRVAWRRPAVVAYAAGAFVIWGFSMVSVMTDPTTSVPFRLVHTVLAFGSMALGAYALRFVKRSGLVEERRSAARLRSAR